MKNLSPLYGWLVDHFLEDASYSDPSHLVEYMKIAALVLFLAEHQEWDFSLRLSYDEWQEVYDWAESHHALWQEEGR